MIDFIIDNVKNKSWFIFCENCESKFSVCIVENSSNNILLEILNLGHIINYICVYHYIPHQFKTFLHFTAQFTHKK